MARPVLVHLPHSRLAIPDEWRADFLLDDAAIEAELLAMTDRYTDELFDLAAADKLVFPVSRLVIDPERFRDDRKEPMAGRGMGAYYLRTHRGEPMRTEARREAALERYYDPHHAALEGWADEALRTFPSVLIIDAHSFPDRPHPCDLDPMFPRPDICLGTDAFHTPPRLLELAKSAFEGSKWSVEVDRPYLGSMVPASRYGRDGRLHSIMVEVNRRLYMDEATGAKHADFVTFRKGLRRVLDSLIDGWQKEGGDSLSPRMLP